MEFKYLRGEKLKEFHKKWIEIDGKEAINFSSNNFLGFDSHPSIIRYIRDKVGETGFGFSSTPHACGIHEIHKKLEKTLSEFFETESSILNNSCYETNVGLFESILSNNGAVFSDCLNHASIIDGIRLSKARRFIFPHRDYSRLESQLQETSDANLRLIVTNGAFSMDGTIANLKKIKELADKYDCLVMVDETFAVGILGNRGKGTTEYCDLLGEMDLITGSFGTALGGFNGGFATGKKGLMDKLRQKSRTYCYSSLIAPASVFAAQKILELLKNNLAAKSKLEDNVRYFKEKIREKGYFVKNNLLPVIPIIFKSKSYGLESFKKLLESGIYISLFDYPVVPRNTPRLRVEISAIHSKQDINILLEKLTQAINPLETIPLPF